MRFLSTVSLFNVNVPVLSLQSTSMPAISSIAVILFVMAPWIIFKTLSYYAQNSAVQGQLEHPQELG